MIKKMWCYFSASRRRTLVWDGLLKYSYPLRTDHWPSYPRRSPGVPGSHFIVTVLEAWLYEPSIHTIWPQEKALKIRKTRCGVARETGLKWTYIVLRTCHFAFDHRKEATVPLVSSVSLKLLAGPLVFATVTSRESDWLSIVFAFSGPVG